MRGHLSHKGGFTLIELSIVLVIIGLIVGGVLVGQDLIRAAAARAQITQIEKYNTAVNTFRGKYGYLPGDIPNPDAINFGFTSRGAVAGEGDGNGIIQGVTGLGNNQSGEALLFWRDLSQANLIENAFNQASPTSFGNCYTTSPGGLASCLDLFYPEAKLGAGNYVFVSSGGYFSGPSWIPLGNNYFTVEITLNIGTSGNGQTHAPWNGMSVNTAYAIDKKMDDGLPMSGNVTAEALTNAGVQYINASCCSGYLPYTTATPGSSTSCYDNGNTAGVTQQYSVEISSGTNVSCALSFGFQ